VSSGQDVEVLVADDDEDTRRTLRILFEEEGYAVSEASDGLAALQSLRSSPRPLVVVLDWWMHGADGMQVLREMAADAELARRHAFVLMSASLDRHSARWILKSLDLRLSVMPKPFDIDTLFADVRRLAEAARDSSATPESGTSAS
jgi:CheY-like chemotaxis protein